MTSVSKKKFLRRKSPIAGLIGSGFLTVLLFCLLLVSFAANSAVSLLQEKNLKKSVQTLLDEPAFRSELASAIVDFAPDGAVSKQQISAMMQDKTVAEAVGQIGSALIDGIIESDDPIDAVLDALEDEDNQKLFKKALKTGMEEINCSSETLLNQANKLAEQYGFAPVDSGSNDLEVVIAVLDGSRRKYEDRVEEIVEQVEEVQETYVNFSVPRAVFGTAGSVLLNLLICGIFYGLFVLLTRSLWKPTLYLGIPYILVGAVLLCLRFFDLAGMLSLGQTYAVFVDIAINSAARKGLIAVLTGTLLIGAFIALKILTPKIRMKRVAKQVQKEQSNPTCPACGAPIEGGELFCSACGQKLPAIN